MKGSEEAPEPDAKAEIDTKKEEPPEKPADSKAREAAKTTVSAD